jgi:hypothetical protein
LAKFSKCPSHEKLKNYIINLVDAGENSIEVLRTIHELNYFLITSSKKLAKTAFVLI